MTDFDNVASQLNEGGSSSNDNEYEANEWDEAPILNAYPQVAISGEVVGIDIMGACIDEAQNIRSLSDGQDNDAVVTLRDPTIEHGTLYEGEGNGYDLYKLVDESQPFIENDGDFPGIGYYTNFFKGKVVDGYDGEYVRLMKDGSAGQRLLQRLDVAGGVDAGTKGDSYNVKGLVEKAGDRDDVLSRIARVPQLREDIEGEELTIFFYLGEGGQNDNRPHYVDVFEGDVVDEDGSVIYDNLLPMAENTEAVDTDSQFSHLEWTDGPTEGAEEGNGNSEDSDAFGSVDDSDDDGLAPADEEFVEMAVEHVEDENESVDGDPITSITDDRLYDDWETAYNQLLDAEDVGGTGDLSADAMATHIDERLTVAEA